jgi:hypothetical protein
VAAQTRRLNLLPERLRRIELQDVEDWLDRVSSPILLKELRLMLRAKLFVGAHVATLLIAALYLVGAMLVAWADTGKRSPAASAELGQSLYTGIQWIQGIAIVLLVPAIAATLISSERERRTLDMLLSSAVRPGRVLAGKFLSALSVVLIILLTLFPLALASWVIGGVGFWLVIRFYFVQTMFGALIAAMSILISSAARASYQAIVGSYVAALANQILVFQLFDAFERWQLAPFGRELYGISSDGSVDLNLLWMTPREFWCGLALPVSVWASLMLLSIAGSLHAITPPHSARSAPLKTAYLIVVLLVVGTIAGLWSGIPAVLASGQMLAGGLAMLIVLTAGAAFISEELTVVSEGAGRWPWMFRTGAQQSLAFCLATSTLAVGGLSLGLAGQGRPAFDLGGLVLGWAWFCAGLVFLLRVAIRRAETARSLFGVLVLALAALPPIVDAILGGSFGSSEHRWVSPIGPVSAAGAIALSAAPWGIWTAFGYLLAGVLLMLPAIPLVARRRAELLNASREMGEE